MKLAFIVCRGEYCRVAHGQGGVKCTPSYLQIKSRPPPLLAGTAEFSHNTMHRQGGPGDATQAGVERKVFCLDRGPRLEAMLSPGQWGDTVTPEYTFQKPDGEINVLEAADGVPLPMPPTGENGGQNPLRRRTRAALNELADVAFDANPPLFPHGREDQRSTDRF